jgi:hypothetical protein
VVGEASTALHLQEERKETTTMPDFDVGNVELNELLKWVDSPQEIHRGFIAAG